MLIPTPKGWVAKILLLLLVLSFAVWGIADQLNGNIGGTTVIEAGDKAVIATTPWGQLGMSICYDLRFAALYRTLAQNGAQFITIPAAFTQTTGKAHWHTLVQARAIETGCYIIAPNQCGHHADKRFSWGHSLIVDPWGEVLADGGADPGIIYADIDLDRVDQVRSRIPALDNGRDFTLTRF